MNYQSDYRSGAGLAQQNIIPPPTLSLIDLLDGEIGNKLMVMSEQIDHLSSQLDYFCDHSPNTILSPTPYDTQPKEQMVKTGSPFRIKLLELSQRLTNLSNRLTIISKSIDV